jgi:hypothetical protein
MVQSLKYSGGSIQSRTQFDAGREAGVTGRIGSQTEKVHEKV